MCIIYIFMTGRKLADNEKIIFFAAGIMLFAGFYFLVKNAGFFKDENISYEDEILMEFSDSDVYKKSSENKEKIIGIILTAAAFAVLLMPVF